MEKVCGALVVGLLLFTVPTLLFSSGLGRIRSPGLYAVDNLVVGTCGSTKPSLQFTLVKTTTEHRDGEGEYLYSSVDESWECKASVTTKWKAVRWYESKLPIAYSYTPTSELSKIFTCRYYLKKTTAGGRPPLGPGPRLTTMATGSATRTTAILNGIWAHRKRSPTRSRAWPASSRVAFS